MTAPRQPHTELSFDEYLAWENAQTERHEYVGGVAHAMTGGTQAHHLVTSNAFLELQRLFGARCLVFSQGFKVRIRRLQDERSYYPDVFVTCQPGAAEALYNEAPCLIVEVLSDSTRRIDLGEKLDAYAGVASLECYLVINPQRAVVQVFRRAAAWAEEIYDGLDALIPVRCEPGLASQDLMMRELYRNLFT